MNTRTLSHWMIGLCLCVLALPSFALSPVEDLVLRKAEILRIVHKKTKKALANAAQDHAFADYFTSTDARARSALKDRIDHISLGLETRFGAEEMCLIDPQGNEISRIVGDRIASDLSHDEAHTNFFAAGFARKPHSVYVSPPYLSHGANKWVVAYVTPIVLGDSKRAILHYERGLDSFQHTLNRDLDGDEVFLITVDGDGYVIADSRRNIAVSGHPHSVQAADYFERFQFGDASLAALERAVNDHRSVQDHDGRRYHAAYATVEDWTLLAFFAGDDNAARTAP